MKIIAFENHSVLRISKQIDQLTVHSDCYSFDEFCWLPAKAGGYHACMYRSCFRSGTTTNTSYTYLGIFEDYLSLEELLETTHFVYDHEERNVSAGHRNTILLKVPGLLDLEIPESDE
jgi:hypothetical protein